MSLHVRHRSSLALVGGAVAGITLVAAVSYLYRHRGSSTGETSSDTPQPSNRLRRSRHIRRRRQIRRQLDQIAEAPTPTPGSDSEDEAESNRLLSLFKEWSDDDSKNLLNLLYAISDNQSRKEGFIHRGITCNKCSVSPIRGVRYKCANCVDFDLCEMCEGGNSHANTHVFLKIRIPIPPLANPRSALLPSFYPGKNHNRPALTAEKFRELQSKSHFDQVELEALYEQFKSLSTVDKDEGGINRETFEQCLGPLGLEKNLITERIFAFFDQDRDGVINFSELVSGLSVLCKGNLDEKIEYAFKGYDLDEDGYISRDELYCMYKSYFYLSMELVRDVVSAMEDEMMDTFEFSASQPVSAAFNVAMPQSSSGRSDHGGDQAGDAGGQESSPSRHPYPLKEDHFAQQYAQEATHAESSFHHDSGMDNAYDKQGHADYPFRNDDHSMIHRRKDKQPLATANPKRVWEEKFPIMETMSQDAINEMVDKTFKSIDTQRPGYISFEEFKQCVQTDASIVSWFEALGTVF
ncbi:uncharacterized protein BYT42DRAFT_616052 [Radiomyces spectabilis]|uniref:uncharacterized protein n=1 Tax=Radiomyces spectabilis TaxID=64574 RepID=UPI00221F3888|nr:uncharacterized protein BYT42DRAFT_616052 [Radiomyces spectabilis]KAI8372847.1 hypothetical protein BYT42DRAFT_616052 [Radiomyces spectabilis]